MPAKKRRNPFFVMLVPVGVAFVVTAFAYWVMAFQAVRPASTKPSAQRAVGRPHPLQQWLRAHGDEALLVELAALAALTVIAIATDRWWDTTSARDEASNH